MDKLRFPIGSFDIHDARWSASFAENINYLYDFPGLLWEAISPLTDDQMQTPYRPDGWTITQVVHHIGDSHINAYTRFKLTLTEDRPTIKPYEEARWAELPDSNLELIGTTMNLIRAIHNKWTALMREMSPSDWDRQYLHPANGQSYSLDHARKMYHWHSAHHLAHITSLVERENW